MKKKDKISILDITPNNGASYYRKNAVFNSLRNYYNIEQLFINLITVKDFIYKLPVKLINLDLLQILNLYFKLFINYFTNEKFCWFVLRLKYNKIIIGDCIASTYFRSNKTDIIPTRSIQYLTFILIYLLYISYYLKIIDKKLFSTNNRVILFCFETTGIHEILRRHLILNNIVELRYSIFHKGHRFFDGYTGVDLRKASNLRHEIYSNLKDNHIEQGKVFLKKLVHREETYDYMKEFDLNLNLILPIKVTPVKKTIILFLSTISDAQYLYGVGPFTDLHQFQLYNINVALENDYNVVIKPHPSMLKAKDYCKKDIAYFNKLKDIFSINYSDHLIKYYDSDNRICIVNPMVSVLELSRKFPEFLCLTQHGSVILECAYLNHYCVAGCNSQYIDEDYFVKLIHTTDDFKKYLNEWHSFTSFDKCERDAMYKYIYLNNINNKLLYETDIFSILSNRNTDSSSIELLINNYLNDNPELNHMKLQNCSDDFVSKLSNNYSNIISNK